MSSDIPPRAQTRNRINKMLAEPPASKGALTRQNIELLHDRSREAPEESTSLPQRTFGRRLALVMAAAFALGVGSTVHYAVASALAIAGLVFVFCELRRP
jgi:hypothetical protein